MTTKINYQQFKKSLEQTGKTYFSFYDLKKFYPGSPASLKTLLANWVKKNLIQNLSRGFYAFETTKLDYLHLANEIDKNSYISFEYALYYYNLIDQIPSVITSATKTRSRKAVMANWAFEYTILKSDLFFGYELKNKIYIAAPEKALADLIYLISRGKRIVELDSLEKNKVNFKKLKIILKKFPPYAFRKAIELGMFK